MVVNGGGSLSALNESRHDCIGLGYPVDSQWEMGLVTGQFLGKIIRFYRLNPAQIHSFRQKVCFARIHFFNFTHFTDNAE